MEFHISASVPSVQREILWGAEGDCSEAWESPDSGAGDISEPSRMLHKSELSLPPSHKKEQRSAEKKVAGCDVPALATIPQEVGFYPG